MSLLRKISGRLLTFSMIFLLTLASGKGRRVIFVSIVFPYLKGVLLTNGSGHLLPKNQLASDGPTSVKPVDMPALNHWDSSFTPDRSLCLVRF